MRIPKVNLLLSSVLALLTISTFFISICHAEEPLKLYPPKVETPPVIDGKLDDPCWQNAVKGENFTLRGSRTLATEQTELFVCYDSTSFYFAFYAHESQPEGIIAQLKERDGYIYDDDAVWVSLDTYNDNRSVDQFTVNSIGTQSDSRSRGTADKIEWKGDWHAASSMVQDGWTVEIEIPFALLNYNAGATSMGFNAHRLEKRLGERSDWSCMLSGGSIQEYGDIEGLELPDPPDKPWVIMPYGLFDVSEDETNARVGVDIKKQFCGDNTFLLTAFPDYGTIENAVKSIDFSYTAYRYGDNRPFFQEARGIFYSDYLYTTSIPDFDAGIKVFGKQAKLNYGFMRASTFGERDDTILTAGYDLPSMSNVSFMVIGRDDDEVNNKVVQFNASCELMPQTSVWIGGAKSFTSHAEKDGTDLYTGFWLARDDFSLSADFGQKSLYFNPASGYVDYPGSKYWSIYADYNVDQPGKSLRDYGGSLSTSRTWDNNHGLIDGGYFLYSYIGFANNTSWSLSHSRGPHIANYDAEPDEEYYWYNDQSSRVSFNFNTNDSYRSGGISYGWGKVGGGPSESLSMSCGFLPMEKLPVSLTYKRVHRSNEIEGSVTNWRGILGVAYEISPEKSLSARVIHQSGDTNFTMSYRQQVRKGLDIFALFGDYNADSTVNKFSVKMVMTL